jgi:hypothetical protein
MQLHYPTKLYDKRRDIYFDRISKIVTAWDITGIPSGLAKAAIMWASLESPGLTITRMFEVDIV